MKRILYIDSLRGFGILLVVLGHILPNLFTDIEPYPNTNIWINSFHMPLFFVISGYFIYNQKDYTINYTITQIYKKTIQLLLPYLTMSLFYYMIYNGPRDPFNFLWYLYTLYEIYIIILFIQLINSMLHIKKSIILYIEFFFVYIILYNTVYIKFLYTYGDLLKMMPIIRYFPFIVLGITFKKYNIIAYFLRKKYVFTTLGVLSLLLFFDNCFCIIKYPTQNYNDVFHPKVFEAVIEILFFWALFMKYSHSLKKLENYFINIGTQTKEIYIIHYIFSILLGTPQIGFILIEANRIIPYSSLIIQILISIPLAIIMIYLSLMVNKILSKNKIISLISLGHY